MAAPLLLRTLPLLRHRFRLRLAPNSRHLFLINGSTARLPFCSAAVEPTGADGDNSPSLRKIFSTVTTQEPPHYPRLDDPDFRKWKYQEAEILDDIEPIICLTKDILHSDRYMDGERLVPEDEKAVIDKLLAHHPRSRDKIGCGLDSIMRETSKQVGNLAADTLFFGGQCPIDELISQVDRHPQFRQSRCLFVIRSDGGWIDFSYQKCLRAYIRDKYPSYAERFIKEHFKRSS